MAKKIYNHFQNDNSVLFSFNGIGFDAIVLRHFFYRNLFNPYLFSYDDRLHIDLLNVAFCARDLSNKINFKLNQKGRKSLKQLDIATANGFDPGTAHTACDDALTLYKLANLFEEEIPEIFYTAIVCGNKRRVLDRLQNEEFFCYSNPWNTKALAFFARNQFKGMENEGYFFNLAADPQKYLNASADDIIKLINTPRSPIIKVGLNKNPILLSGLRFSEKIGINPDEANRRAGIIRSNEEFIRNFHQALHKRGNPYTNEFIEYPEMAIYQGFPSREDGILAAEFSHASYTERMQIMLHLKDFRLKKFAQRLLAIEHPDQCSRSISKKYKRFTKMRLLRDNHLTPNLTITGALDQIDASIAQGFDNQERIFEINNYLENLRKEAELL